MSKEKKYTVSVGLSKPKKKKIFSKILMLIEGTNFSHVFVSWQCEFIDRRKVYEAVASGSRKISNVRFKEDSEVVAIYEFEVDEECLRKIDQYTHDESGTPYGFKHLVGIGIMRIKNFFKRLAGKKENATNPFRDRHYSQICVEAGAYVIELGTKVDIPGDIENYGLKEFGIFLDKHGKKVPQEKINRINGKN
jgi:hypothetical protein